MQSVASVHHTYNYAIDEQVWTVLASLSHTGMDKQSAGQSYELNRVQETAPTIIDHRMDGLASLVYVPFLLIRSTIFSWTGPQIGFSDETDHLIIVESDDSTNYGLCSHQCQKILSPMLLLDSVNHNAYSIPLSKLITSLSCIFLSFVYSHFALTPYWGPYWSFGKSDKGTMLSVKKWRNET